MLIYRYVEPFWMFGLVRDAAALGRIGRAAHCHGLRPQPLLPLPVSGGRNARPAVPDRVSHQALERVQHLRICQKACEWGAIEGPRILVTECVRCDDCERCTRMK